MERRVRHSVLVVAGWLLGCSGQAAHAPKASPDPPVVPLPLEDLEPPPFTPGACPPGPPVEPGPQGTRHSRTAHPGKPIQCAPSCTAESMDFVSCVDGHEVTETISAPCECGPMTVSANQGACTVEHMTLRPTDDSPVLDGCRLDLRCEVGALRIDCDGEEDGTGASLCDCYSNGELLRTAQGLFTDPGVQSCYAAAPGCVEAATRR